MGSRQNFVPLFSGPLPYNMYKLIERHTEGNDSQFWGRSKGLFASDVWGGAVVIGDYFRNNPDVVKGKNVIEVGAAGALPSMVALALGAKHVVVLIIQILNYSGDSKSVYKQQDSLRSI